jgi:hypothetical protein
VKIKYPALAASLLAFEAGCPLLQIEAEVPEACLTYSDVEIDGSLAATSVDKSFTFDDLSEIHDRLAELDAGLAFTRAEVRVKDGVDNLGFVQEFHASVASGDPASTLPTLVLFDCRGDCQATGASLAVDASTVENALEYLQSSSLVLDVKFVGEIPQTMFKLDIDVCVQGHAGYTFEP